LKKLVLFGIISLIGLALSLNYFDEASARNEDPTSECRSGQVLILRIAHNDYVCTESATAQRWQDIGVGRIVESTDITKTCLGRQVGMTNINTGAVTCIDEYRVNTLEKRGWVEISQLDETEVPSEQLPATEVSDPRLEDVGECKTGFVALENPHNGLVFCSQQSSVQQFLSIGWVTLDDVPTSIKEYRFPVQTECRTGEAELKNWGSGHVICTIPANVDTLLSEGWEFFTPPPLSDSDLALIRQIEPETTVDPRFEMEEECPVGNVFLENPSNGFIHCANKFSVPTLLLQGWVMLEGIPTSETDYHFPHLGKCEVGEAELKHSSTGHIICTAPDNVDSLLSEGWEFFTPPELSDLEIQSLLNIEKEIQDASYTANLEVFETDTQDVYRVIFQGCAKDSSIRDPIISITSDTQQQKIQLTSTLHRNDCAWGATHIRALDPSTIKAQTVEFGDNENLAALEEKIQELREQVEKERQELVSIKNTSYNTHQQYIDAVREQSAKLDSLGRELRTLASQYYTYMFYLHR